MKGRYGLTVEDLRCNGPPDVVHKSGSTRYKYDHAVWIEEVWDLAATRGYGPGFKEGKFYVYQGPMGQQSTLLGEADSLAEAERIAAERAEPFHV